jgi:hypothetical protein
VISVRADHLTSFASQNATPDLGQLLVLPKHEADFSPTNSDIAG